MMAKQLVPQNNSVLSTVENSGILQNVECIVFGELAPIHSFLMGLIDVRSGAVESGFEKVIRAAYKANNWKSFGLGEE
jgi:hypothetical protein